MVKAVDCFEKILLFYEGFMPALFMLGYISFEQGHYESAADSYETALSFSPGHVRSEIGLAAALYELGRLDQSRVWYQELVSCVSRDLLEDNPQFLFLEAKIHYDDGHLGKSIVAAEKALNIALPFMTPEILVFLAEIYFECEPGLVKAKKLCRSALEKSPEHSGAQDLYGRIFYRECDVMKPGFLPSSPSLDPATAFLSPHASRPKIFPDASSIVMGYLAQIARKKEQKKDSFRN